MKPQWKAQKHWINDYVKKEQARRSKMQTHEIASEVQKKDRRLFGEYIVIDRMSENCGQILKVTGGFNCQGVIVGVGLRDKDDKFALSESYTWNQIARPIDENGVPVVVLTYTHAVQGNKRNIVYLSDRFEFAKKHFLEMIGKPVHVDPKSTYKFTYKYKN